MNGSSLKTMGGDKLGKLSLNLDGISVYNGLQKPIVESLLLSGQSQVDKSLFHSIDEGGVQAILDYTKDIDWKKRTSLGDMTIQTVLGGSEKMSLKTLAYFLPALQIGEQLLGIVGKENMPKVAFTVADGAAIHKKLNGFNEKAVKHESSQMFNAVMEI